MNADTISAGLSRREFIEKSTRKSFDRISPKRIIKTIPDAVICGGMWSVNSQQWSHVVGEMTDIKFRTGEYPGHGDRYMYDLRLTHFTDYVASKVLEARQLQKPVVLVGHSLGVLVAAKVAQIIPEKVRGIIGLACAVPAGVKIPVQLALKMLNPRYLQALFGHPFTLTESNAEFVRDGSDALLDLESGHVLREIILGIEVPKFSELHCPVKLIIPIDDQVIPWKKAIKISLQQGIKDPITVPGGHFSFCQKGQQETTLKIVHDLLHSM